MLGKILITDSLFIFDTHVKQLEAAGFEVERLDKPNATEDEICLAVKGKAGYILGGTEHVTEKIIDAADQLKAISLLGIGYQWFIPAWKYALDKGISITNTPSGPTHQVAEWALTAALMMNRDFLELGRAGKKQFAVTKGVESQKVGIVGFGRIGAEIARLLRPFKPQSISYYSRHRKNEKETELNASYTELSDLLAHSDIIFVCVGDEAQNSITERELLQVKQGSLLVNVTHPGIIAEDALLEALQQGRIRAISDYPMSSKEFDDLPLGSWYCMNSSNTITEAGSMFMSDMATSSMVNLLTHGSDEYSIGSNT
jgi:lactate dehydrogenase-like 2-hydroxyacid dehydrogenase